MAMTVLGTLRRGIFYSYYEDYNLVKRCDWSFLLMHRAFT